MNRKKQGGFTLLELVLVIAVVVAMAIVAFQEKMLEVEEMRARQLGMELFRYNMALQNYIAHESGNPNPASLTGTFTGVSWLKGATCGGSASSDWLPCTFLNSPGGKTTFGALTFTTTITYSATNGLNARTVLSKLAPNGKPRGDLSGLAALVAAGAYAVKDQPSPPLAQDGTVAYCPDITTMSAAMASICGANKDQIIMLAKNLSDQDKWLRVDHGNVMQNTLEFRTGSATPAIATDISAIDGFNRQIRNVARIYNLGNGNSNGGADNLILGKRLGVTARTTATLASNAVIVDADQEILGKLKVSTTIESKNAILSTDGNITAKDAVGGNNATLAGNIEADHNIWARGNLIASGNANITGNATANGTITAVTKMSTPILYDYNNAAYYVDPNGVNRLKTVDADIISSRSSVTATSNVVTPQVQSASNVLNLQSNNLVLNNNAASNLIGNVDVSNLIVKTRTGKAVSLMQLLPNYVHIDTYFVHNGNWIPKPVCAATGTAKVIVTPTNSEVNVVTSRDYSITPYSTGRWIAKAKSVGASWQVSIYSALNDKNTGTGLASVYCLY
jgi:prepilin-type N-terminal cleavage/methylation domain